MLRCIPDRATLPRVSNKTEEAAAMSFDKALVKYPDGRSTTLTPAEFYAIPLADRINLLTSKCLKFEKGNQPISPLDALRKP